MKIGNRTFAPRLLPTAVMAAVLVLLLALGDWQLDRMREKQSLFAAFAAGGGATVELADVPAGSADRYQHVAVQGHYDSSHQFLLDNMTHAGRVGYRVLTPLLTETGERIVLVDRGWLPMGRTRETLPEVPVAECSRRVVGRLDDLPRAGIELAIASQGTSWPRVLSYPQMKDLSDALQRPLHPRIILLDADQPAGFVREWQPSTFPPQRHLGYAITWFALAAAVIAIYVATNLHRSPKQP